MKIVEFIHANPVVLTRVGAAVVDVDGAFTPRPPRKAHAGKVVNSIHTRPGVLAGIAGTVVHIGFTAWACPARLAFTAIRAPVVNAERFVRTGGGRTKINGLGASAAFPPRVTLATKALRGDLANTVVALDVRARVATLFTALSMKPRRAMARIVVAKMHALCLVFTGHGSALPGLGVHATRAWLAHITIIHRVAGVFRKAKGPALSVGEGVAAVIVLAEPGVGVVLNRKPISPCDV
jgi:hypothetical protein